MDTYFHHPIERSSGKLQHQCHVNQPQCTHSIVGLFCVKASGESIRLPVSLPTVSWRARDWFGGRKDLAASSGRSKSTVIHRRRHVHRRQNESSGRAEW
jgi:hypothetical protein